MDKNKIMNKLINGEVTIDEIQGVLKMCPFCGGEPEVWESDTKGFIYMRCENPNCWAGATEITGIPDQLIDIWNSRVPTYAANINIDTDNLVEDVLEHLKNNGYTIIKEE